MYGCLRRLGCLVLLVAAGGAYLARDLWWPRVAARASGEPAAAAVEGPVWESLDYDRAARGERAVRALAARNGPVYVNLRAGDLASYVFLSLTPGLPIRGEEAQAAVVGDRIEVRAPVALRELGGAVGGLGALLPERDTLRLGGTLEVVRPGLAQFRLVDVQVGRVPLPASAVAGLVRRVREGRAPEGVEPDALPVRLPPYIGDVRVARGRITLYKATP